MTLTQLMKWVERLQSKGLDGDDPIFVGRDLSPIIGGAVLRNVKRPEMLIAILLTDHGEMLLSEMETEGMEIIKP